MPYYRIEVVYLYRDNCKKNYQNLLRTFHNDPKYSIRVPRIIHSAVAIKSNLRHNLTFENVNFNDQDPLTYTSSRPYTHSCDPRDDESVDCRAEKIIKIYGITL